MKMTTLRTSLIAYVVACVAASHLYAGPQVGIQADAFVVDDTGSVAYEHNGTSMKVKFGAIPTGLYGSIPPLNLSKVSAAVTAQDPVFIGDYVAAGAEGVAVKLACSVADRPWAFMRLECETASGRTNVWDFRAIELGGGGDAVVPNNISLSEAAGWSLVAGRSNGMAEDLRNVKSLGVIFQQRKTEAQTATVADLRLLFANQVITPSAVLDARIDAHFPGKDRASLTAEDRRRDSDGDGIPDYLELTETETDPDDANSALRVTATRLSNGALMLEWPGVVGCTYSVFRTDSPGGTFGLVPGNVDIYCDATGVMSTVVPNDKGKYFYCVKQVK